MLWRWPVARGFERVGELRRRHPMADTSLTKVLGWDDISDAARIAFAIWTGQPELEWARSAWTTLVRAGLANYRNERERCQAAIHFLTLAGLYHDFCAVAWKEFDEPGYRQWAEELCISPFRVGQLVSDEPSCDEEDDDTAFRAALVHLVAKAREAVLASLLSGFGGVSGLFGSLWRSGTTSAEAEDYEGSNSDDGDPETEWQILNDVTPDKLEAFSWLDDGCPAVSY